MKNNSKNKNVNAKKKNDNNKKGFTLIELLAVIVIMAVLMITAIPAITQAIARSRRDTYATNAKKVIDSVRTAVVNEEFTEDSATCQLPGPGDYIEIDLMECVGGSTNGVCTKETVLSSMLERGGKSSPFGKNYKAGKVYIVNKGDSNVDNYYYYISLIDDSGNGISDIVAEKDLKRSNVAISGAKTIKDLDGDSTKKGSMGITGSKHICKYAG